MPVVSRLKQLLPLYLGTPFYDDDDEELTWMDYLTERDREQDRLPLDYKQWDDLNTWKHIPFKHIHAPGIDVRLPPKHNCVIQESDEDYDVDENDWRRFMAITYE